jgi:hypothetical protein
MENYNLIGAMAIIIVFVGAMLLTYNLSYRIDNSTARCHCKQMNNGANS